MKQVNDAFRTNPDASTISEDFFNKALHIYGDDHFPTIENIDLTGRGD